MKKYWVQSALFVIIAGLLVWFIVSTEQDPNSAYKMKYGLDLSGGTHLVYEADVSEVDQAEVRGVMEALKTVIERRVNLFGVSEPLVQTESSSIGGGSERLIVELPGVTDVKEAIDQIGKTPLLEFKLMNTDKAGEYQKAFADYNTLIGQREALLATTTSSTTPSTSTSSVSATSSSTTAPVLNPGQQRQLATLNTRIKNAALRLDALEKQSFVSTGLTGRLLKSAQVGFSGAAGQQQATAFNSSPLILIEFNEEGSKLFEKITRENVGKNLAIFLDGQVLSSPTINEPITGGSAQITGSFTIEEARTLARDLSYGALPVPIELVSTQTIGPSLGETARSAGIKAGLIGLSIVALFLILWYRLPGLISTLALAVYFILMITLFKWAPIVMTSAGIAGFILSLGMAVDANILVFERMKEEFKKGDKTLHASIQEGFSRAWSSIRDGNSTTLISAVILYLAGTPLTKGFAVTLALGVVVSVISSMIVSRAFIHTVAPEKPSRLMKKLFGSGLTW